MSLYYIYRKLHNEELRDLYSLPNIVRVVKSRRVRWAGQVARMGEAKGVHRVLVGKPEGKEASEGTQTQMGGQYLDGSSGSGRGWRLDGVGSG